MAFRTLLAVSALLYALIVWASLTAPAATDIAAVDASPVRRTTTADRPTRSPTDDLWLGCAISLHHTDRLDLYLDAINTMVDTIGFTSLEVVTPAFQTHGTAPEVGIVHGPGAGPYRDQLLAILRHARARGMRTALLPIVLLSDPVKDEWRGHIRPDDWPCWWKSYAGVMDYFVDVANEGEVDLLSVGSELLSTEAQTDRWAGLIRHVRKRYDGQLTYSTNWDHYHVPQFWPLLDLIGMNAYWDLTVEAADPEQPHFDEVVARWRHIRAEVLAFARRQKKPVLFTELGYPSLPWGLRDPWNYVNRDGVAATPQVQALGYSAFLSAWDDLLTAAPARSGVPTGDRGNFADDYGDFAGDRGAFAGAFFYHWDPYHRDDTDTGYGVQGKTTLDLLKAFLNHRATVRQGGR